MESISVTGRGAYTHEQVATAIEEADGPTISATYLWQLRKGLRDNPTKRHLEALSLFFGVPPSYFFELKHRLEQVRALETNRDRSVADARAWVEAMLGFQVYSHHLLQALHASAHGNKEHVHGHSDE